VILGRRRDGTIDRQAARRALQMVDPKRISSIEVLKGVKAMERFGPSGENGAALIRMTPASVHGEEERR
jgi:hypothetical protein